MRSVALLVLIALLSLFGCSAEEGNLTLALVRAPIDEPYSGVDQFVVRVLDMQLGEVNQLSASSAEGDLDLGVIPTGTYRLEVQGLAGEQVVALGHSRPLSLEGDVWQHELVPFATPAVAVALPAAQAFGAGAVHKVDAWLDEWQSSPSLVLDNSYRVSGPAVEATDLRAELSLAWDTGHLYFSLLISDDCPALKVDEPAGSCGTISVVDRLFFGFDGTDDNGTSYGANDVWLELIPTKLTPLQGTLREPDFPVSVGRRYEQSDWVVEGALNLAAIGRPSLSVNDRIGFDLVVVDEDPGQAEPTVLRWSKLTTSAASPTPPVKMGTLGFAQP